MLGKLQQNPNDFWRRSIMHNKTWIYHKTPESTEQSKQWDFWEQSISKMAKVTLSANKVMGTVFCDASYMFFVYYLENGKIIKEDYYHSKDKKIAFGEETNFVSWKAYMRAHLFRRHEKIPPIIIRTASESVIISRFRI